MTDNNVKPNRNTAIPYHEPKYLKALNSKPSNRKVGQVFITTTKLQPPNADILNEEKLNPLQEKTIQDIMKEYREDRLQALNIQKQNNIKLPTMNATDKAKELPMRRRMHSDEMLRLNTLFNIKNPSISEGKQLEKEDSNDNTIQVTFIKKSPRK